MPLAGRMDTAAFAARNAREVQGFTTPAWRLPGARILNVTQICLKGFRRNPATRFPREARFFLDIDRDPVTSDCHERPTD